MKTLNGWQRLWVSVTAVYLVVALVGAYIKQPTSADVQITEVIPFLSTSTLELLQAAANGEEWIETVEDGVTIAKPAQLDPSLAKAYSAEFLTAHRAALRHKRLEFLAMASAGWALPSLLLLAIGYLVAWVRLGFALRAT